MKRNIDKLDAYSKKIIGVDAQCYEAPGGYVYVGIESAFEDTTWYLIGDYKTSEYMLLRAIERIAEEE